MANLVARCVSLQVHPVTEESIMQSAPRGLAPKWLCYGTAFARERASSSQKHDGFTLSQKLNKTGPFLR